MRCCHALEEWFDTLQTRNLSVFYSRVVHGSTDLVLEDRGVFPAADNVLVEAVGVLLSILWAVFWAWQTGCQVEMLNLCGVCRDLLFRKSPRPDGLAVRGENVDFLSMAGHLSTLLQNPSQTLVMHSLVWQVAHTVMYTLASYFLRADSIQRKLHWGIGAWFSGSVPLSVWGNHPGTRLSHPTDWWRSFFGCLSAIPWLYTSFPLYCKFYCCYHIIS